MELSYGVSHVNKSIITEEAWSIDMRKGDNIFGGIVKARGVRVVVQKKEILVGNKSLMLGSGNSITVEPEEILVEVEQTVQTSK